MWRNLVPLVRTGRCETFTVSITTHHGTVRPSPLPNGAPAARSQTPLSIMAYPIFHPRSVRPVSRYASRGFGTYSVEDENRAVCGNVFRVCYADVAAVSECSATQLRCWRSTAAKYRYRKACGSRCAPVLSLVHAPCPRSTALSSVVLTCCAWLIVLRSVQICTSLSQRSNSSR